MGYAMDVRQTGTDMVMNQQTTNGRKNGNGLIRKFALWGTAIVSVIVISVFISSQIGGLYRTDWQIEQHEKTLESICVQIKEMELKIKESELDVLQHKTEMTQRLKILESKFDKIEDLLGDMKTDMAVIKEINKNVKKLAGN